MTDQSNPVGTILRPLRRAAALGTIVMMAAAGTLVAQEADAQSPDLPSLIKIVVPFTPGGSNDMQARVIAQALSARTGKNVIVENRPGGSTFIGLGAVARSPQDGSTLLLTSVSSVTASATKAKVPVDLLKDLTPVAILGQSPLVVTVNAESKMRTPADLIAAARAKPDSITNGTPGMGTIAHLAQELLDDAAKIELRHIPYTGGAPARVDLLAGRVDINIVAASQSAGDIAAGKLRVIGHTGANPTPALPGVPPMATAVPGFEALIWTAVWAPAGTPAPIVDRINRELNEITKTKEFLALLKDDGGEALALTPAASAKWVGDSLDMWKKVAKSANVVID